METLVSIPGPSLITGGAGFIGSHLAKRLLELGVQVRVVDDLSTGHLSNLDPFLDEIEVIEGDIRSEAIMDRALAGIDTVFHMAAVASVPLSIADPKRTFDVNVTGTLNALIAARDAGCRRVVFSSSCAVYGNTRQLPASESALPSPTSPYATSKLNGEQLCSIFTNTYGLETVSLRYFNVFGPGQDPDSPYAAALPRFLDALLLGSMPVIFGDGLQTRDFVYVDNIVDANVRAATAPGAAGRVFNVGSGHQVTINDALAALAGILSMSPDAIYAPERAGDLRHSVADITAAQSTLGFSVRVPFAEGLERYVSASVESPV